jgi:hypothetical protein
MKNILLFLLFTALINLKFVNAQAVKDSIKIHNGVFGTIYVKDGKSLTTHRLFKIISANPETLPEISSTRNNNIYSWIFGGAGGFILGYQMGTSYSRTTPNWFALGAAAGLIGISMPFEIAKAKHTKRAVLIYNKDFLHTTKTKAIYNFGISNDGAGIKITF